MQETYFQRNLRAAQELKKLSDDPAFLDGYIRGLRRCYHGEKFGTEKDHHKWMALSDETGDRQRKARGEGYRWGLLGVTVYGVVKV